MVRYGKKKKPFYRLHVADSRRKLLGKFIENVGTFDPFVTPLGTKDVRLNVARCKYWLSVGAQPSKKVEWLFGKFGILPPAPRRIPRLQHTRDRMVSRFTPAAYDSLMELQKIEAIELAAQTEKEAELEEQSANETPVVEKEAPPDLNEELRKMFEEDSSDDEGSSDDEKKEPDNQPAADESSAQQTTATTTANPSQNQTREYSTYTGDVGILLPLCANLKGLLISGGTPLLVGGGTRTHLFSSRFSK